MSDAWVRLPELIKLIPRRERDGVRRLADTFDAAGHELHLVDGIVRDLLLDRGRTDLDFTTSATPGETKRAGVAAAMRVTAPDLRAFGLVDEIVPGPTPGHDGLAATRSRGIWTIWTRPPAIAPRRFLTPATPSIAR